MRRDTETAYKDITSDISTHAPRVRRDVFDSRKEAKRYHFYSRASCEARLSCRLPRFHLIHFYSRASCEARLDEATQLSEYQIFLLTRLV